MLLLPPITGRSGHLNALSWTSLLQAVRFPAVVGGASTSVTLCDSKSHYAMMVPFDSCTLPSKGNEAYSKRHYMVLSPSSIRTLSVSAVHCFLVAIVSPGDVSTASSFSTTLPPR